MMAQFASYNLQEKIHETRHSIIYRGYQDNASQSVIIKLLKTEYPTPSEIARFRQEYKLIKNIDLDGVIRTFDIISHDGRFALILEDFNGLSIKSLLDKKEIFDIPSFLDISAKIAETVGSLHVMGVIHRDIKPHNILINRETGAVKLTDFGISAVLTHEDREIYNPDFIASTLAYTSPEQTGRMNRRVDYRTDLYSLGVTMYEMLTGDRPFKSHDPMELVHSHIAVMPTPPDMIDPGIPDAISAIILKLLAKTPEERYQSGFGVLADIKHCAEQFNANRKIETFELGRHDISSRFIIPQKVFGRKKEIGQLISRFDAVATRENAAAVMVVAGAPGIGKSAIINELHRPIVARKGYFIAGKYEQFRKDKPYSAIIQAFQSLVKQILSEGQERISRWRKALLDALDNTGKVITDVIPEVELIVGKQPDLPELGPEESRNRFNFVFEKFTSVFPAKAHPIALLLDDLQWADLASLELLKNILTGSGPDYFFLILSYRDNEVGESHPVMDFLRDIEKNKVTVDRITPGVLSGSDITDFIVHFLRCSRGKGIELAELVLKKTGGNPFFVNQFLHTLYNEKIIIHEGIHGWQWDADKIDRMQVTDNIVEMMAGKIGRLSADTRDVLRICACIGNRFDLETLASVRRTSVEQVLDNLTEAINEGMVSQAGAIYAFNHDRIQEAAYSLVPDVEKSGLHYQIGKLALDAATESELQNSLFYIVNQLNLGGDIIKDTAEQEKLAMLNLEAARKAKASAAYEPALAFSRMGISLLPDDSWESHYQLAYLMHKESMESEYLSLHFSEAEKTFNTIVKNAQSNVDRANVHSLMIILYTTQGNYEDALRVGYQGMKMVGFNLPRTVSDVRIGIELLKLRFKFGRKKIEDLMDMRYVAVPKNEAEWAQEVSLHLELHPSSSLKNPDVELPEKLSYAFLAIHTATVAYYINVNLFAYIAINGLCMLLDMGINFEYSPYAYLGIGSIVGSSLGFPEHGYRFGLTALRLNEKIADTKNRSRVEFTFAMFIQHWKKHAIKDLDFYRQAFKNGLEVGDFIFCGHSIKVLGETRIMLGDNLDEFLEEYETYRDFQMGSKDPFNEHNYQETMQMYRCLKDLTGQTGRLSADDFDEHVHMSFYREGNNLLGIFYLSLIMLRIRYLFGNYIDCLPLIDELNDLIRKKVYLGALHVPEAIFYASLVMTAGYRDVGAWKKIKFKKSLIRNQMKMKKWAGDCPENFEHKYLLVEAERLRLRGNRKKAAIFYERAIQSARENQYTQNEAVANELAANFMREAGEMEKARQYMKEAHYGYIRWGATAKVKHIEEKYSDLITAKDRTSPARGLSSEMDTATEATPDSGGTSSRNLDLTTVIKTSQALSSEIELDKLLVNIMKLSMENAGAQYGCLMLANDDDGKLSIMAAGKADATIEVMKSNPLEQNTSLAVSIVNYVQKTGENVVLGNAGANQQFMSDPYVSRNRPKSILCAAIKRKEEVSGIIYLENNLATDAFTPERLEVLKILSAQAAISIENAKLFELATTDGLTKLYVRRYFHLLLDKEIRRSRRHNNCLAVIMTDIDNFKVFNDTYGHQLGDKVLSGVADVVKKTLRAEDSAARYGGEEFIALLPETDAQQAMDAAERIRLRVAALETPHGSETLHVAISLGVAVFPVHAEEKEALIHAADIALYKSKHRGKNCVSLFEK
ncbi:MAG: diguanylate cyclase [Thermodesulfobacteriota bacterium]|nr:diguanylate cyclase [Thermodesulfobacteriota bacterium]